MINFEALFKVSYGLYIVSSGNKEKANGFISNTFFQVTAEPAQFAACCNKDNLTSSFIEESGCFTVSVLQQDASSDIIGRFGYKTGRSVNKMEGMDLKYGETGAPIVTNESIAYLECKVLQKHDVGTHWLFIGELVAADNLKEGAEPLTYAHYRNVKKGVAPKNAPTYIDKSKLNKKKPTASSAKYKCNVCGYVYDEADEDKQFDDLPHEWICPVCGAEKDDFSKI